MSLRGEKPDIQDLRGVEEEEVSFNTLRVLAGSANQTDKLIGEEHTNFIEFLYTCTWEK